MLLPTSTGQNGFKIREFQTPETKISLSAKVCGPAPYNIWISATKLFPWKKNCSFASTENWPRSHVKCAICLWATHHVRHPPYHNGDAKEYSFTLKRQQKHVPETGMERCLLTQATNSTRNARKTSTPILASAESTPQTFRCQMVLWRVFSKINIGKGTPWAGGLHGWQAPRTNASRTIVTRTESRTKYGTWYHIPYFHEYVAIALHNDVEIVLLGFPAVDIADNINKILWFKNMVDKPRRG